MQLKPLFTDINLETKSNIASSVFEHLKELILKGEIPEGTVLSQSEIAMALGVSRIPVREAFFQLASEGLIDLTPNKKGEVTSINKETLEELFEIRMVLESLALRSSIPRMSMLDIEKLNEILQQMTELSDHHEWIQLNRKFHMELYQISGKKQLCNMIQRLSENTERLMYRKSSSLHREERANKEHREIVKACENREIDNAVYLLEQHLRETLDGMIKNIF